MLLISFVLTGCSSNPPVKTTVQEKSTNTTAEKKTKKEQSTTKQNTNAELQKLITSKIPDDNGTWSVYYKDLKTGQTVSVSHKKMVSASLIKLFIMATVYDRIQKGDLEDSDEIEELMRKMITVSHNDSSNELVSIVGGGDFKKGMKIVNAYAQSIHCPHTEQQRNMLDSRPVPIPEQNYTCTEHCGKLLEMIYRKKCVNAQYSETMLNYMLAQKRTWKIPSGLPEGTKCANKTGELSDTENDVAIIFPSAQQAYILCIMSNDLDSTSEAQESIRDISAAVFDYVTNHAS